MENQLKPGAILFNRYQIKKALGQGGFGITYLAEHAELHHDVCIKELFVSGLCTRETSNTIRSQNTKDLNFDDFIERFLNEARELAKFNHTGIVRVSDMFRENGTAYIVMEYVEGKTLKQLVTEMGAFSFEQAKPIVIQLLDALEVVHQKGMLHRDIKPDNIIITPEGRVVLIDFGSARSYGSGHTMTQTAILTPGYAPIEQYSEKARRGPYTDIYSVGATLYFMLTGQKPMAVTDRSLEILAPPHDLKLNIDKTISSAVMLAMNLRPEDRFQTAVQFKEALLGSPADQPSKEKNTSNLPPPNLKPQKNPIIPIVLAVVITISIITLFVFNLGSSETTYYPDSDSLIHSAVDTPQIGAKISDSSQSFKDEKPRAEKHDSSQSKKVYKNHKAPSKHDF